MFLARVYITLKPTVNDPQGQTVLGSLKRLGFAAAQDARVGKFLEIKVNEADPERAAALVTDMCRKLLANPVIEDFRFELEELSAVS